MSHKVDISEVIDFSTDLEDASLNVRSSLEKVQQKIEAVNNMDSFTGKAADEAKIYFTDLHLTLLESFRGLFDDLDENLNQHIKAFGSEVDASESAIMESNYLQDIKEDINELFESLKDQDESISDTISDVSDITSASSPDFSDVHEWKKKSVEKLQEVDEDLDEFTGKDNEVDVEAIMHHIEAEMSKATTSKGKARFADFKGASDNSDLAKLMEYNEEKQNMEMEKAKDAKDSALEGHSKPSEESAINMAYNDYKKGNIKYDQYVSIINSVKNTNGNMSEKELKEHTSEEFINYLKDRNLLESYLEEHQSVADYVVKSMPGLLYKYTRDSTSGFLEKLGYTQRDLALELIKTEEGTNLLNKTDPKLAKGIKDELNNSAKFFKYSKYTKYGSKALGGIGSFYTVYDDVKNNGKTKGEGVAHAGTAFGVGALAMALTPAGWATGAVIGIGIGATFLFELAYNNSSKVENTVDKVGEKLSEWGEAAKGMIMSHNPRMINPALQFMSK